MIGARSVFKVCIVVGRLQVSLLVFRKPSRSVFCWFSVGFPKAIQKSEMVA